MGLPVTFATALTAASANNIALSQSLVGASALTLNGAAVTGGVASLGSQRRVLLTSAGNDSGIFWTVVGTNQSGATISDTFAGANGAASSNIDFSTVTRISSSGSTAAAVTAGASSVGSSPWRPVNWHAPISNIGMSFVVTGTVNYTLETTLQDPNNLPPGFTYPVPFADPNITAQTANQVVALNYPIVALRVTINSGTGTVRTTYLQSDISGP